MKKYLGLFLFFVFFSIGVLGCASFLETERQKPPQTERRDPYYTWSSFFNNDCGPTMKFKVNSEDEAILNYQCLKGKEVSQDARRHKRLNEVELWAASDLPVEQLYKLSNSKCRASLIYLGPTHATIKFPCALVHLTVTCEITSREASANSALIHLIPKRVLITYGDGVQEFKVDDGHFTPLGPFKPFVRPESQFIFKNIRNNLGIKNANLTAWNKNRQL